MFERRKNISKYHRKTRTILLSVILSLTAEEMITRVYVRAALSGLFFFFFSLASEIKLFHRAAFIYLIIQGTRTILTAVRKYTEKGSSGNGEGEIKLNFAPFVRGWKKGGRGADWRGRGCTKCCRDHQATHRTHQSYSRGRFINSRLCNLTHYVSTPFITSSARRSVTAAHRFPVNFHRRQWLPTNNTIFSG